jgi:nicotinate-nucleotide pyrophosphorylase (carboxylating)
MNIQHIIQQAIAEDLGTGDHTSLATIPEDATGQADMLAKQPGILAGLIYVAEVFRQIDNSITIQYFKRDGDTIQPGNVICSLNGPSRSIVAGERLALNLVQRLSGIATYSRYLVDRISKYPVKLLDTRKTTPLLREMEKYAVRMGGGENHRLGLFDMIMIKDNHVDYAGGIVPAIERVNQYLTAGKLNLKVVIEVRDLKELEEVMAYGKVDRIMLDNFSPEQMMLAIKMINNQYETEASGGITEDNIEAYAATGVSYISVGALTHQIRSLDISLNAK